MIKKTRLQKSAWKILLTVLPACLIGLSAAQEFQVHPSTQLPARLVTLDILEVWEEELSNWGRWGPDDQRGTLNLITPEKTRQAAALVQVGETVTLQHFVIEEKTIDSQAFGIYDHWMSRLDPVTGLPTFALDEIQFSLHDGMLSHLDAHDRYAELAGFIPLECDRLKNYRSFYWKRSTLCFQWQRTLDLEFSS